MIYSLLYDLEDPDGLYSHHIAIWEFIARPLVFVSNEDKTYIEAVYFIWQYCHAVIYINRTNLFWQNMSDLWNYYNQMKATIFCNGLMQLILHVLGNV